MYNKQRLCAGFSWLRIVTRLPITTLWGCFSLRWLWRLVSPGMWPRAIWYVLPKPRLILFYPESGGNMFLWNVGNDQQDYTESTEQFWVWKCSVRISSDIPTIPTGFPCFSSVPPWDYCNSSSIKQNPSRFIIHHIFRRYEASILRTPSNTLEENKR